MKKTIRQFVTMLIICAAALQMAGMPITTYAEDVELPGATVTPAGATENPAAPSTSPPPTTQALPSGSSTSDTPTTPTTLDLGKYLTAPGQSYTMGKYSDKPITIGAYIVRLISFLSLVIGSFAFVVIVIGGITLLASAGSETGLQKGKDMIKFAIIGLVVALSAYYITAFVQSIFYEYG